MHITIAQELAAARQAEMLRAAEIHRTARLARASRPTPRPTRRAALATLARSATEIAQRLRRRPGQVTALGSPRQSPPRRPAADSLEPERPTGQSPGDPRRPTTPALLAKLECDKLPAKYWCGARSTPGGVTMSNAWTAHASSTSALGPRLVRTTPRLLV